MLSEQLEVTSDVVDTDWDRADLMYIADYDEVQQSTKKEPLDLMVEDYELIINTMDGEISLGVKAADFEYQLPATMTTKDGQVYWLTVPKKEFKAKLLELKKEQTEKDAKDAFEKAEKKKKARALSEKLYNETKDMIP